MDPITTEPPKNSFYFEIEEYEIPEPEPFVPEEVPVAAKAEGNAEIENPSDVRDVEEVKPEVVSEIVKEPEVDVSEASKVRVTKKKEKAPLKPEISLTSEELDNVLSKLPETMQEALTAANEEGQYVFRGTGSVAAPPTRGASVSRKIFPPAPPTDAELKAAKLAREQQEQQKNAIHTQTQAPAKRAMAPPSAPPGFGFNAPAPSGGISTKQSQKDADKLVKEAQKASKELAKEETKIVEATKKAEEQAKKDAAAALKAADKARAEAEALAAQEKAEREIFRVENFTPEGNLSSKALKRVVITFNHPLETKVVKGEPTDEPTFVPKVTPAFPAGRWSVEGKDENALVFEADNEVSWPLSTKYTVKIVAGSMGAKNRPLASELVFHFTTPTVLLTQMFPGQNSIDISPSAPIVLVFDQPIDTKLLLSGKHQQLTIFDPSANMDVDYERCEDVEKLKALQKAHQAGDSYTKHIIEGHADCHWIALLPKSPLKRGAVYIINLATELTSTLGPVKSREPALDVNFTTRSAFWVNMANNLNQKKEIELFFSWPICGPKQDLTDVAWLPTITPTPPVGVWTIDESRKRLLYRVDDYLGFEPSTEYVVTIASGLAKSFYDQPLERNPGLAHWHSNTPLPQLLVDVDRHRPSEPLWWSFVTTLNVISRTYPVNDSYVLANQVFLLETEQPLDETKFVANVHFYCRKRGVVAGLTSLVKKEKPFGVCEMVPWDSTAKSSAVHREQRYWAWSRTWSKTPIYQYAFKCSRDFLVDHDIEMVIGPHLHSLSGPVPAVLESKTTFQMQSPALNLRPNWILADCNKKLRLICPAVAELMRKVSEASPMMFTAVFEDNRYPNIDDFKPNAAEPSGLAVAQPKLQMIEKAQVALTNWQTQRDALFQKQDAEQQRHIADVQAQQTALDQYKQALVNHAKATRDALKAGQPAPPPVAPITLQVFSEPPTYIEAPRPGDLPMLTAEEMATPWAPRHLFIVPFSRPIANDARDALDWTPIITPAPPAGKWLLHENRNSYVYVPDQAWNLSTKYTVSLPPNARCAWNVPIEENPKVENFIATPTGAPEAFWWPAGSSSQLPVMPTFVISFNQCVTPSDLKDYIQFNVTRELDKELKSPKLIKATIVKEAEWKQDETIANRVKCYAPEKFVVVRPVSALPYRSEIEISVLSGFQLKGGNVLSTTSKAFTFHTVPTFEITSYAPTTRALTSTDPLFLRFNQPLVKVEAHFVDGDYKLPWTPALSPKHPGKWSLQRDAAGKLNPLALKFTPLQPWKKATEYTVTIPAGTASLVGEVLQSDFTGSSSTPVVDLIRVWPSDGGCIARKPLLYFEFDSLVNDTDVLASAMLHSKCKRMPMVLMAFPCLW